jgi:DNA-binding transcriptional MerR regulator
MSIDGGDMVDIVYTTSEVAKKVGIHPNTVRLYEELKLISAPIRRTNGYRVFTKLHLEQFKIARTAFQVEVLQNGLRKQAVEIIKTAAAQNIDKAIQLTLDYIDKVRMERQNAEEAIIIVDKILTGQIEEEQNLCLTRKEAADYLHITIDTLRNWELNGLVSVNRKRNGYRVYMDNDMKRLKIIRSLRCANYSLSAILRMLRILSDNPQADIREAIDTSQDNDDIITACDNLLTSLNHAEANAGSIYKDLLEMKNEFYFNPTL